MALIDPLLRALGWDVFDPEVVAPEYKVAGGWADYALLRTDGKPAAILEAKKLGEALSPHRMQMLNYANAFRDRLRRADRRQPTGSFTESSSGLSWMIDENWRSKSPSTPAHTSALELLLLWRPNLAFRQAGRRPTVPILGDRRDGTVVDPSRTSHQRQNKPPLVHNRCRRDGLRSPNTNRLPNTPCPGAIRFWDGSEQTLQYWHEMLTGVVKRLHSEGRLTVEDVPIGFSPKSVQRAYGAGSTVRRRHS